MLFHGALYEHKLRLYGKYNTFREQLFTVHLFPCVPQNTITLYRLYRQSSSLVLYISIITQ